MGECAPLPRLSCDDVVHYPALLAQFCQLVTQTKRIPYALLQSYPSMLFGIETAWAQLHAAGSWQLFNTPFAHGMEGITMNGLVWMGRYDEMLQRLADKLSQGFHCIKFKIGAIDFEQELALLARIRARYSAKEIEIRVDANGAFNAADALQRLEQLVPYDLVLKPSLHGGMYGTKEWISLAQARHIDTWMTSALESNVGLNAIAQFCAHSYGSAIALPQGLGTGQLFTNNVEVPLQVRGEQLWFSPER